MGSIAIPQVPWLREKRIQTSQGERGKLMGRLPVAFPGILLKEDEKWQRHQLGLTYCLEDQVDVDATVAFLRISLEGACALECGKWAETTGAL